MPITQKRKFKISVRAVMSVFIFLAVVMMGLRIQEVTNDIMAGNKVQPVTPAKAEAATKDADKPEAAHAEATKEPAKSDAPAMKEEKQGEGGKEMVKEEKPDPINTDPVINTDQENYSEAEVNILKRLSERRQELDKRSRDVDQREALLKITEQRIDKKLGDMKTMQEQIRAAITTATAEQKAKTDSLVKIYEIMKPKDAAHIFDALDMSTLLAVISNMKESRVAPILAAMDAQKAKQVTAALMEKKPLPTPP
jgi:flagellar motility protein MotE (MotC chaperone)